MQVQAVPQHPQDASVALQTVRFSYDGKNEVIKGVSLEIQPGQTVAFVGPSGGGKSTLANLICRFFDVQSGSVRVGGADVRDISKEELMDTIRFVRDNFNMTILLIEHDMKLVSGICEKLTVLNFGQVLREGATSDVLHDPEVIKA